MLSSYFSQRFRASIIVLIVALLIVSASGCASLAVTPVKPILQATAVYSTLQATATPVIEPTRAASATPSDTPTPAPTATDTPTPTPTLVVVPPRGKNEMGVNVSILASLVISATPAPTPVFPLELPRDTINVLLLGSDNRPGEKIGRTDTIIVASINPQANYVSLLSIPRDLYVFIPGLDRFDRINTVDIYANRAKLGRPVELLAETIRYNLGIPVHYYARINFAGVQEMIDRVNGVDVLAHCALYDVFPDLPAGQNDIITDTAQLSTVPTGTINIPVPGLYNLDGKHALWFARSRYSTNDFDRSRRQQAVLRGLWSKIKEQGLVGQLPSLWNDVTQIVDTNLNVNDVAYLATFGLQLDDARIKQRSIDRAALESFTTATGAQVLLIAPDRVPLVIGEAFTAPLSNVAAQAAAQVEVVNGSGRKNWELLATDRLTSQGFIVPRYEIAEQPITRTQIINYQTTNKGSRLNQLLRIFNLKADRVINQPTENSSIAFRLLIGPDFDTCKSPTALIAFPAPTPTSTPEGGVPPTVDPNLSPLVTPTLEQATPTPEPVTPTPEQPTPTVELPTPTPIP
ncbi:Polyisoprenyl-teichoic acid--peptidoglycan teichoic acid transferase TagT [Thermoflexales bacterium]|nr:Polyisoprenyl-teichoic acid--peptidoglycan teichoic acid transferase TagT [Thermoflexales bacterium]